MSKKVISNDAVLETCDRPHVNEKPDITGQTQGKWTILGKSHTKRSHYIARCVCGTIRDMKRCDFVEAKSTQCIRCRLKSVKANGHGYA